MNGAYYATADGSNQKIIAEGAEVGGVSWSPNNEMIVYRIVGFGSENFGSLYIYDIGTHEHTKIDVEVGYAITSWSPSGEKLAFSHFNGGQYNSGVVNLKFD